MNIVYFSHSYRKEDAFIVSYFGRIMRNEGILPSLDPPSKSVNAAKLERHLNTSEGMIAVITKRDGGISQHILYEINLCLRARKPILIFIEDTLPNDLVPFRILQRRFSRKSYLRYVHEHRHGIQILKTYLGVSPLPTYQTQILKRSCLIIGTYNFHRKEFITDFIEQQNYQAVIINQEEAINNELIFNSSIALSFLDALTPHANYLLGMVHTLLIPSVAFTSNKKFPYKKEVPLEYQARILNGNDDEETSTMIKTEFDIFEEDFVELDNQEEVDKYSELLIDMSDQKGNYKEETRNIFISELIMRDQYKAEKAGVIGPNAHGNTVTFNENIVDFEKAINLDQLAEELSKLRNAMKLEATVVEQDIAVSDIARAEQAAQNKDTSKVIDYLKSAGSWALDVATKIGVAIASEALKRAI